MGRSWSPSPPRIRRGRRLWPRSTAVLAFAFTMDKADNYRMRPEHGGGALLDVGFYVADVARWMLGEPERVEAVIHGGAVDMSCSALLSFAGGAQASLFASFEAAEHQELVVVCADRVERVAQPFTGGPEPLEQYR